MKRSVAILTLAVVLIGTQAVAGGGDVIVNGSLGIGTTSPSQDLEVLSNHSGTRGMTIHQVTDNGSGGQSYFKKDRAGNPVVNGDYVGTNKASVYDGSAYLSTAGYGYKVNGPVSVGSVPTDLYFYTGSVQSSDPYGDGLLRMIVTSSGSVGIGTTSPVQDVEVLSNHSGTRGMTIHQVTDNGSGGQSYFKKDRAGNPVMNGDYVGTNKASVYDGSAYLSTAGYGYKVNGSVSVGSVPTDLYFYTGSVQSSDPYGDGLVRMIVTSSGSVGIGTTSPAPYKLSVNGTLYATSYSGSDVRWKKNIAPISNAASLIEGLTGVMFDWRTEEFKDKNFDNTRQVGLIAQDVEKVLPEIVKTDTDGYKAVSYERLTAVLVEALKEQQREIRELKTEIDALKAR